jgi:trk system potassium uptake protein TrkA
MARFTVIGLGKFGSHVARSLFEQGHEVVGIDADRERVQDLRDHCTQSVLADCTEPETLRALEVAESDAVVLSIGERMEASILVTLYLKELGARRIVAKAMSPEHGKVLSLIGAHEIVHPERETAIRVAKALGTPSVVEYLSLGPGHSLLEVAAPAAFVGRTLAELEIRKRHQVLVVAVRRGEGVDLAPGAGYAMAQGDIMVVIGRDVDLEAMAKQFG